MELYDFLEALILAPTPSGFESLGRERILELVKEYVPDFFDESLVLKSGSLLFHKAAKKKNAKKAVLDAHIDTIGFAVSEICDGGFVKVTNLGGIDPFILPSARVKLYGKKIIDGVFTSVPPHLAGASDKSELKISDLYVDTALSDENLREYVEIGTPGTFAVPVRMLENRVVASHSLDDKACAATLLEACKILLICGKEPECDLYIHLSVGEEKTGLGAATLPYEIPDADACIVTDVNFAKCAGVKDYEALAMSAGPGISLSASINRELSEFIESTARKNNIPVQTVVEMRSTGTNATRIHKNGIPCAVLSLPLKNMHTDCECVSLCDIESCARLLASVLISFDSCPAGEVILK